MHADAVYTFRNVRTHILLGTCARMLAYIHTHTDTHTPTCMNMHLSATARHRRSREGVEEDEEGGRRWRGGGKLTEAGQSCQTDARIIKYYQSHWGSVQG